MFDNGNGNDNGGFSTQGEPIFEGGEKRGEPVPMPAPPPPPEPPTTPGPSEDQGE